MKKGLSKLFKGNDSKELDGMNHNKRGTSRKRRTHKKSIETKLRRESKRLCKGE